MARTLEVGPGLAYAAPSAAAAAAADGDTITIAPGEYFDCAVWKASRLTIVGPGATLTDRACEDKAAFVVKGDGVALRGLTFARIRVPDGNGAGVRGEGRDLTVADSRFVNDQDGILMAGGGFLRVEGCTFTEIGAHAVLAGALDLLRVSGSVFEGARGGDHIVSAAGRTELDADRLADAPGMTGPLVRIAGGAVALTGNTVELGSADRVGAMLVTGDATSLEVRGNTLAGHGPLVRNWGGVTALVSDNHPAEAVSDTGSTWHRFRASLAALRGQVHARLGAVARGLGLIR